MLPPFFPVESEELSQGSNYNRDRPDSLCFSHLPGDTSDDSSFVNPRSESVEVFSPFRHVESEEMSQGSNYNCDRPDSLCFSHLPGDTSDHSSPANEASSRVGSGKGTYKFFKVEGGPCPTWVLRWVPEAVDLLVAATVNELPIPPLAIHMELKYLDLI